MQGLDFNFCYRLSSFVFATAALVTTPQTNTTDEPSFPSFATEHTLPLISMNIWEMVLVSFSGFCWIWLKGRNKGLVEFLSFGLGWIFSGGRSEWWWKSIHFCDGLERVEATETRTEMNFGFGKEQILCLRSGGLERAEAVYENKQQQILCLV